MILVAVESWMMMMCVITWKSRGQVNLWKKLNQVFRIRYNLHPSSIIKGSLKWIAHMEPPLFGGYRAFYVRLSFSAGTRDWSVGKTGVMDFTTTVSVVPNNFPHPDCNGDECLGTLL